jgi:hypothetical protein
MTVPGVRISSFHSMRVAKKIGNLQACHDIHDESVMKHVHGCTEHAHSLNTGLNEA